MLAAVLKGFNNLVLEDVPAPESGTGEVVVRIKSCRGNVVHKIDFHPFIFYRERKTHRPV